MKIKITSLPVRNQDEALTFYTEILGFVKKTEVPMGEHKWLTVVFALDDSCGNNIQLLQLL